MPDFSISEGGGSSIGEVMTQGIGMPLREVVTGNVSAHTIYITDDAGDGTPHGDLNATDFGPGGLYLTPSAIYNFVHKAVLYQWVGPKEVSVGLGGDHTAIASDLLPQGTADHALLLNKEADDSHPTSAITGLDQKQSDQDAATALVQSNLDTTNSNVTALTARVTTNEGDISTNAANITSNDNDIAQNASDIATNAANHAAHLADNTDGCHDQYATEAAALATFTAAGYGGIGVDTPVAMPDIGASWLPLTGFDVPLFLSPRWANQDFPNNGIRLEREGVWQVVVKVTLTFAEANAGRVMSLRVYNTDTGLGSATVFRFFVGRNQSGVNLNMTISTETSPESVGQLLQLQVSSETDSFTGVSNLGTIYQVVHVSEAKGLEQA